MILEKEGYNVIGARDGKEAYKALQDNGDITAAVFDVVMPHIAGPELVRFMKTEKRFMKIPVMMMTAEQDPKLSRDSFAAGAVVCGGARTARLPRSLDLHLPPRPGGFAARPAARASARRCRGDCRGCRAR